MSYEYNKLTIHLFHYQCHKVITNYPNVLNKLLLKDGFSAVSLFKLPKEMSIFITVFIGAALRPVGPMQ